MEIGKGDQAGISRLKQILIACLFFLAKGMQVVVAQQPTGLFTPTQPDSTLVADPDWLPQSYRLFELDTLALKAYLALAPRETDAAAGTFTLEIPLPDSGWGVFRIVKTALMSPSLAAAFPQIQTWKGWGITDPRATIRLDYSPSGMHIQVLQAGVSWYADPAAISRPEWLRVYYPENIPGSLAANPYTCMTPDNSYTSVKPLTSNSTRAAGDVRIYRLAVAATGEYTQFHGGSVASGLAAVVTTLNRVAGIYERDLGIGFQLVASTQSLIFTDPLTDPFTNGDVFALASESQIWMDTYVENGNYDLGHVFCTAGGGLAAYNAVCQAGLKAKGISGRSNPVGDAYDVDIVAHEIGHQFGAHHSQNNSCGRYAPGAFEPASGSTIMAYAGFCPPNLQMYSDDYFHLFNLIEIKDAATQGSASGCPVVQATGNHPPQVHVDTSAYVLPKSTPFALKGFATDTEGDTISYNWEQFDLGPGGSPWNPQGYAPLFRSFPPQPSGCRYFPSIGVLLAGVPVLGQALPTFARPLHFRLTARDNHPSGSEFAYASVAMEVTDLAGPFEVTSIPTPVVLNGGMPQRITWKVAGTDHPPVNCHWVTIVLSRDGGLSWTDTLAQQVANNGSAWVAMPNVTASACRLMVAAADHVFFQINGADFSIQPTSAPGFVLFSEEDHVAACIPNALTLPVISLPIGGFNQPISYYVVGLPAGIQVSFLPAQAIPGDTVMLVLDSLAQVTPGSYPVQVVGGTSNGSNFSLPLTIEILGGVPAAPLPVSVPDPNAFVARNYTLRWHPVSSATAYRLELARSPVFSTATIFRSLVLADTLWQANPELVSGGIFYWRVWATNACGNSSFSPVESFHVIPVVCRTYTSLDVPLSFPYQGTTTLASQLPIQDSLVINSVAVKDLKGTHSWVSDLRARLIGPDATYSVLFSHICGNDQDFHLGFNDQTVNQIIPCPPTTGQDFRPQTPLSAFQGKSSVGNWVLEITDDVNLDGGQLDNWGLEICAEAEPSVNPWVVENQWLSVTPGSESYLSVSNLEVTDGISTPSELVFTLVYCPSTGRLKKNGYHLYTGFTFLQEDISNGLISFEPGGSFSTQDSFVFVVTNPAGGWLGNTTFHLRNGAATGVAMINQGGIQVYPNPASQKVYLQATDYLIPRHLVLVDVAGRQVAACETPGGMNFEWRLPHLPAGCYYLIGNTDKGPFSHTLIIVQD